MKKYRFNYIRFFLWCIALTLLFYGLIQLALPMIEYTSEVNTKNEEVNDPGMKKSSW